MSAQSSIPYWYNQTENYWFCAFSLISVPPFSTPKIYILYTGTTTTLYVSTPNEPSTFAPQYTYIISEEYAAYTQSIHRAHMRDGVGNTTGGFCNSRKKDLSTYIYATDTLYPQSVRALTRYSNESQCIKKAFLLCNTQTKRSNITDTGDVKFAHKL